MNILFLIPTAVMVILAVVTYLQNKKLNNQNDEIQQLKCEANRGVPLGLSTLAPGILFQVKQVLVSTADSDTLYLLVSGAEGGMWEGDRFLQIERGHILLDKNPNEADLKKRYQRFGHAPNYHDTLRTVDVGGNVRMVVTLGVVVRTPTTPLVLLKKDSTSGASSSSAPLSAARSSAAAA